MKEKKGKIVVAGSIVYDRIMDFSGSFKDHILPEKIHMLNVAFVINTLKESFGGTGANIAYSLSLLEESPILLGIVGRDFDNYEDWLKKNNIDISKIKKIKTSTTASAYITTDQENNQITAFHPGPSDPNYPQIAKEIGDIELAIISPDSKDRMLGFVEVFKELGVPYIFDPGQQITAFQKTELEFSIKNSKVLIGNDYEIDLIQKIMNIKKGALENMVDMLVVTKGAGGSVIVKKGEVIKIEASKAMEVIDPTGAGDAYRSGLMKGLASGWDIHKIGKLASLVSAKAVEKQGAQNHFFNYKDVKNLL